MPHRRIAALACAVAFAVTALVLAGCGSREPSDREQVRSVLADFAAASAAKDYGTLCDRLLAPELLKGIQGIGLPCEVALRNSLGAVENPRLTVGQIDVTGSKARAEVRSSADNQRPSRDTLELVKLESGWKVSSLSAAPDPAPASSPSPAAP